MAVDRTAELAASLAAGAVVAASPVIGDYVVIVLAAIGGAFVNVSRSRTNGDSHLENLYAMARGVMISAAFAWLASLWLATHADLPFSYILAPTAFLIAFIGDDWFRAKDIALDWLASRTRRDRPHD